MTEEAKQKLQEFRDQQGKILIDILDTMTEQVEEKYGKDMAMGFTLGIDTAYLAITGKEMADVIKNRSAND